MSAAAADGGLKVSGSSVDALAMRFFFGFRRTHRSVPLRSLRRYSSSSTRTAPPATLSPSETWTARTVAS
jgi:hypothetical protein